MRGFNLQLTLGIIKPDASQTLHNLQVGHLFIQLLLTYKNIVLKIKTLLKLYSINVDIFKSKYCFRF